MVRPGHPCTLGTAPAPLQLLAPRPPPPSVAAEIRHLEARLAELRASCSARGQELRGDNCAPSQVLREGHSSPKHELRLTHSTPSLELRGRNLAPFIMQHLGHGAGAEAQRPPPPRSGGGGRGRQGLARWRVLDCSHHGTLLLLLSYNRSFPRVFHLQHLGPGPQGQGRGGGGRGGEGAGGAAARHHRVPPPALTCRRRA